MFSLYKAYNDGFLPELGGINAQPAKFMDIIDCIRTTYEQCPKPKDKT